jgi:hypothetical protein
MLVMLSVLFRVVLVLFLVRLGLRMAVDLFAPRRVAPVGGGRVDELVRDRVCNTFVPRTRSVRVMIGGHEEHFCSTVCAQRALTESAGNA